MALEFPASPSNGDLYDGYQYNATLGVWEFIPEGGRIANGIILNANQITADYALPTGFNGVSAGPITIADGVTVTVPAGSGWSIV